MTRILLAAVLGFVCATLLFTPTWATPDARADETTVVNRIEGKGEAYWLPIRRAYVNLARTVRWQRRQARLRFARDVDYAYRLASVVYGIPESQLRTVGYCESRHYVFARNGQYRGVMQEGPMFERGPFGRAGFSVWDPVANVMTAAYTVRHDGSWRQWACQPDGTVR